MLVEIVAHTTITINNFNDSTMFDSKANLKEKQLTITLINTQTVTNGPLSGSGGGGGRGNIRENSICKFN